MHETADQWRQPAVTMSEVAAAAGVSRQTVSLVLAGKPGPSAASRERVADAAQRLGFRPNAAAQLLRRPRTGLLGVAFIAHHPYQSRFVECLAERAPSAGLRLSLAPLTPHRSTDVALGELLEQRVEAVVCFNPDPHSTALRDALARIPVVWLGEPRADERADAVHVDSDRAFEQLVDHLVELGHRSITYVGGRGGRLAAQRAASFDKAIRRAGITADCPRVEAGFWEEDGADAAREILRQRPLPTAVVCCSDSTAVGVLSVLQAAGVAVPGQVSVTGFDDSPLAQLSYIQLTTVRQDIDVSVAATLDIVRHRLADPQRAPVATMTQTTLVVRRTTGPAPQPGP